MFVGSLTTVNLKSHIEQPIVYKACSQMKESLKCALQTAQSACTTVDIWSSRQMKSYIGIAAHFIKDWSLHGAMLACKRFKGSHTADRIAEEYEEVMSEFGLESKVTN